MTKNVTVIVPTRNEVGFIAETLQSICRQDYPTDNLEIIVADGMSDDGTQDVIREIMVANPHIILVDNPEKTVPFALNRAIKKAKGEIIVRMDSHSSYPVNYISRLVSQMEVLGSTNIGGVVITQPANEGLIATGIALAISHPLGIGNSEFRLAGKDIKEVDTVPFGCFKRSLFEEIGYFDTDLTRNQDDEFNGRIIKNGGKIFLLPDLKISYFGRDSIKSLHKMFYHYGLFKPLVNKKLGSAATLRQFVPPGFVLFMAFVLILPWMPLWITLSWSTLFALYLLLDVWVSLGLAIKHNRIMLFLVLPMLFPIIHMSYGWGYWQGFVQVYFFNSIPGKANISISR